MVHRGFNARTLCTEALLVLCLASCPKAFAVRLIGQHQKHDYKREVELLEEQWRTAQLADDVPTMDKLMSDDYVGISMDGQVNTKAQQLSRMRSHTFVLTRIDIDDMKVKLVGQVAIVTVRASVQGANEGQTMDGTYRYTRIYQRMPDGVWKTTNFEATRIPSKHLSDQASNSHRKPS